MNQLNEAAVLPGVVRQLGHVVRDLDAAVTSWLGLGIGPWYLLRGLSQSALYRGEPCTVPLSMALSNSGDMQIELIQQDDETPSIYTEFLASGRDGLHQLAWWTSDFESTMKAVQAAGWPVAWSGAGSARYAYVEPPASPVPIVEIMELTDATIGLAALIRQAAEDWDGNDPIRTLG